MLIFVSNEIRRRRRRRRRRRSRTRKTTDKKLCQKVETGQKSFCQFKFSMNFYASSKENKRISFSSWCSVLVSANANINFSRKFLTPGYRDNWPCFCWLERICCCLRSYERSYGWLDPEVRTQQTTAKGVRLQTLGMILHFSDLKQHPVMNETSRD